MRRDIVMRVLGPVRLLVDDAWVVPATPQLRLVMGLMALRIGQVVPVEELADAIWETDPPRSARASLQSLMTRLRYLLRELPAASLTRVGDGYLLELDRDHVDAERFRSLGRSGRAADGQAAIPLFDAALALWNGPALADALDTQRVKAIRHGLAEEHLSVLQDRLACMLACGREREAAAELPAALARFPLNERLAGMLMASLHRSGQRADALSVFRQTRSRLVAELGVEPSAELQLLHQRILAGDASLAAPPPRPGEAGSLQLVVAAGRQTLPAGGRQAFPADGERAPLVGGWQALPADGARASLVGGRQAFPADGERAFPPDEQQPVAGDGELAAPADAWPSAGTVGQPAAPGVHRPAAPGFRPPAAPGSQPSTLPGVQRPAAPGSREPGPPGRHGPGQTGGDQPAWSNGDQSAWSGGTQQARSGGSQLARSGGVQPFWSGGDGPARSGRPERPAAQERAAPLPLRPWHVPRQLPTAPAQFVDRGAELARLDELIGRPDGQVGGETRILAIVGLPGVGKSALATVWAHRAAGHFPGGQLYVNLKGFGPAAPLTPEQAIRGFLQALGVPSAELPESLDAQAALYRSILAGKQVLVVLDNARDAEQVRALLPGSGECAVLITSRARLDGLVAAVGARILTLDVMSPAESRELIAGRLGPIRAQAEPEAVADLARLCAGLPLGLAIVAARAAARPGFRLAALSAELTDGGARLDALETSDTTSSVREVFSWSCRHLSQPAARMFRLLGLHPGPDISAAAAASLAAIGEAHARRALHELTSANLVTEHVPGRFTGHDLLRAYAAELADEAEDETGRDQARRRLADHYLHTAAAAAGQLYPARPALSLSPAQPGTVPEQLTGYAEAQRWFGTEHQVLLAVTDAAAAAGHDERAWQLPAVLTDYLNREGHWHDLDTLGRTALAAAERAGDGLGQAHARCSLGVASLQLGCYDAAHAHLLRAITLFGEAGATSWLARTQLSVGVVFDRQGQHDQARMHAEQALRTYRGLRNRAGEAHALENLGWHLAMLGSCTAAVTCCQRALDLHRELGNLLGEAHALDHLGYASHRLGDDAAAIACYRRALDLLQEVRDRSEQGGVLARLGDIYSAIGNAAMAKTVWRRALAILEELHDLGAEEVRSRLGAKPGPAVPSVC